MKPNVMYLPLNKKLVCDLTTATCPRSSRGHRYMGVKRCSGCHHCTIKYPDGTIAFYVRSEKK